MRTLFGTVIGLILFGSAFAADIEFLTPELIDHGRVEEGTECEGSILFVNTSNETIKIKKVQAGCGCTATSLDRNDIAPGDTAVIHYVLRTKQYSGLMRKAVSVHFAQGGLPFKRFILQADVYTDILFHPKYLHFRGIDVNPDTLVTEVLTVNNKSDEPLVCRKIYTDAEAIHATPAETIINPGELGQIEVSLKPSEAGRWTYYLHIDTNHKLKTNMRIPVFAHVR